MSSYYFIGDTLTGPIRGSTGTFTGNVTVGGTLAVTGNLSAANYNYNGLAVAQATVANAAKPPPNRFYDDMGFVTNNFYYAAGTTGSTGAGNANNPPTGAGNGALQLSTTTGAANGAVAIWGFNYLLGRQSSFRVRIGFWLPNLSDGTETYTVYLGSWQTAGLSPSRQCVYLKYTHSVASGAFQIVTNNGATTTTTSVTVAANTYYVLDYTVTVSAPDTANNPVTWAIYAGGSTTAAATGSGVVTAPTSYGASTESGALAASIVKSAGTTARTLQVDFWEFVGLYS